MGVEHDQRTDSVCPERYELCPQLGQLGDQTGMLIAERPPADLHAGALDAAASKKPGRGRRLGQAALEVDSHRVAQALRRHCVEVRAPRLQPVGALAECQRGLLRRVDRVAQRAGAVLGTGFEHSLADKARCEREDSRDDRPSGRVEQPRHALLSSTAGAPLARFADHQPDRVGC